MQNKYKGCSLSPINSKEYKKIAIKEKAAERPLNSILNITKLENFLKLKMPYWDNIFEKKIVTIIKKYSK